MPTNTRLSGHYLFSEGAVFNGSMRVRVGRGTCSCGAHSPQLDSDTKRKKWHRGHKAEIKAAAEQAGVERALAQMMRPGRV